jgi:hypothetical protein
MNQNIELKKEHRISTKQIETKKRMQKSALPYMRKLLNDEFQCKQKTIEEMIF